MRGLLKVGDEVLRQFRADLGVALLGFEINLSNPSCSLLEPKLKL